MGWWARAFGRGARDARNVDAALWAALLATLDGDLDRAERKLRDVVGLDSDPVAPYQALARLFRLRGEIGRAIRIHQNLLMRSDLKTGRRVELLVDLAADFRQGGFLRKAIASYEEVLGLDRRHRGALRALVRLLAEVDEVPRAIQMNRRLARLEREGSGPREARLRVEMATAARAEGRGEEARRSVKKAVKKDPDCVDAWVMLGDLEAERGRLRSALAAWNRVPELDRQAGGRVYPQLESTFAGLGREADYEQLLRRLLETKPDDVEARLALARALATRGDVDESIAELRFSLEYDPDDLQVRAALGRILLSESRDLEASKEHEELLEVIEGRRSRERRE